MMFFKMLKGALIRRKTTFLMISLTMCLGISLATAMLNVMFDVGDKVNKELKSYGANLTVMAKGASLLNEMYDLSDEQENTAGEASDKFIAENDLGKIKMIFWAYNIVDFAPMLDVRVKLGDMPVTLVGTWFDKHLVLPTGDEVDTGLNRMKSWWDIEGELGKDADTFSVLVGRSLAEKKNLAIGSSLTLSGAGEGRQATVIVRGIFHSGGEEDEQIYSPILLAQNLSGHEGLVRKVEVSALTTPENELARRAARNPESLSRSEWDTWYCTAYISSIAYQIEEILPNTRARAVLQVSESEGVILQKTQLLMTLMTILTLACSALAISNLVTGIVVERSAEIGLLKALGATNLAVALLVLTEIFISALFGGALGYGLGLGFAELISQNVFNTQASIKILVIPLTCVLVLLITLLGSLPALRILLGMKPKEILHGR